MNLRKLYHQDICEILFTAGCGVDVPLAPPQNKVLPPDHFWITRRQTNPTGPARRGSRSGFVSRAINNL